MPHSLPPESPRGRPPAGVLLLLCAVAVTLHGCLLDGMPLEGVALNAMPAPVAASVQVRSLPMHVDAEAVLTPPRAQTLTPPPAVTHPQPAVAARHSEPFAETAGPPVTGALGMGSDVPVAASPKSEPARSTPEGASPTGMPDQTLSAAVPAAAALPVLRQVERTVPVYRTRIPPATVLGYDIRRGMFTGSGELSWRPAAGRYEARLQLGVAGFNVLTQTSQGGFDKAGLAPLRFIDQRGHRPARAANFQRDAHKITYSSKQDEYALPEGAQDRLSWMIQLPAVVAAEPRRALPGGEVLMVVSGARADVAVWTFAFVGAETIDTGKGPVRTLRFTRTPQGPRDLLADVWLDPSRHHLPVRAQLSQGEDGDVLEMVVREQHSPAAP